MADQIKAYFVYPDDGDHRGYIIHATTPGKAKTIVWNKIWIDLPGDWLYLRAERKKHFDNLPITIQNMIDAGYEMTFEGEPITELDVKCPCPLCVEVIT